MIRCAQIHLKLHVRFCLAAIFALAGFLLLWLDHPALGAQVSSRSASLSNSAISATSNIELRFTVADDIAEGETLTINFPDFTGVGSIDCGDIDVASSVEFGFNSSTQLASCAPTATAWGFASSGNTITITAPSTGGVYVPTSTEVVVRVGSNATSQEQGNEWITNPSTEGTRLMQVAGSFQQTQALSTIAVFVGGGIAITVTVAGPTPTPTPVPTPTPAPPSGGGGGGAIPPPAGETAVVLQGKAYPRALLTALKDGQVTASVSVPDSGLFEVRLTGISPGIYTFGVFAQDPKGRKSLTLSFTLNVIKDMTTTVSGIFIPPTIITNRDIFYPDEMLEVDGYSFPQSNVNVVLSSAHEVVKSVPSDADGLWVLSQPLDGLGIGDHSTRARTRASDGDQSTFSETRLFRIVPHGVPISPSPVAPICRGADLNFDGKVNLTDFSIMLFWWQSRNPGHPCVDINKDGVVNLVDFSIMMYQWAR